MRTEKMTRLISAATSICAISTLTAIIVALYVVKDINTFHEDSVNNLKEFDVGFPFSTIFYPHLSQEYDKIVWNDMISSTVFDHGLITIRGKRQTDNSECQCGPTPADCPTGPPGPPGAPGDN